MALASGAPSVPAIAETAVLPGAGSPESPAKPELSARQTEGAEELEQASRHLDAGEEALEDDERRRLYELSVRHAKRAVELIPDDPDAHFVLFGAKGRIAQMGGLASATLALSGLTAELDEVLRLDPEHPDALAARGGMYMKLPRLMGGNTSEGVRYLERACALNPTGAGTHLELAEAYEIIGRDTDAYRVGRQAIALAEKKGETEKADRARRFVTELERSCEGCAMAAAGR